MMTLAQAVADSIAAPRPILFLDTCTLLDMVRAPLRDLTLAVRAGVELRALAAAGYPNSRVLVSSNRSEFAAPNATVFHPDIVPDAGAAGLWYAVSMEAAVADLRAAGEIP